MSRVRTSRTPEAGRRPDIEEFLLKYNVSFTFREGMNPRTFDLERSLKNQARLGQPLDPETVQTYVSALHERASFPPVLAHWVDDELVIVDGNHRLAAHLEADMPIDTYVCEAPPQILTMITFLANTTHGKPASVEDRVHHALYLIDGGLSLADAAAAMSVSAVELRRATNRQQAARRADDAGVPRTDWDRIPSTARVRLAAIITDEGFKAGVELVKAAGLTSAEINEMVAQVNESRSGRKQKEAIAGLRLAYADRLAEVATSGSANRKGFRVASPRSRLGSAVGMILSLPPVTSYTADPMPEVMRAEFAKRIDDAVVRLTEIREALT